jgi:hypothetical protein
LAGAASKSGLFLQFHFDFHLHRFAIAAHLGSAAEMADGATMALTND